MIYLKIHKTSKLLMIEVEKYKKKHPNKEIYGKKRKIYNFQNYLKNIHKIGNRFQNI